MQGSGVSHSATFAEAYSFEAGRREMLRLLDDAPAEAYFCGDDVLSIGALSALQSKGLRVPDDVGILGLHDMEMAAWENVNLTTIRNPIAQIIETSIDQMLAMLDDPNHRPKAHRFDCEVVERGTLRPAR